MATMSAKSASPNHPDRRETIVLHDGLWRDLAQQTALMQQLSAAAAALHQSISDRLFSTFGVDLDRCELNIERGLLYITPESSDDEDDEDDEDCECDGRGSCDTCDEDTDNDEDTAVVTRTADHERMRQGLSLLADLESE